MTGRFVRQSKFRHIFGKEAKKEQCYDNISITRSSQEAKFSSANSKFLAVCVYAGGGGSFLVIPLDRVGRQDVNAFKVAGHTADVLDLEWNPFDDHMIASSDEDGAIKIWSIPENGLTSNLTSPLLTLSHQKKCCQLTWHPVASNILLSVSYEPCIAVWNLESGELVIEIPHPDLVYNADWSANGSKLVSACKDKLFRIFNPRTGEVLQTVNGHSGGKPQRVIFLEDHRLFSTGFSKMSSRQYCVWDLKDTSEPILEEELDSANGTLVPYFDRDINILYLAGKGDSTIRYYEINDEDPYAHWISNFGSKFPHRALCMAPKRACDISHNEIARFYRLLSDKHMVEPVTFTVPRKTGNFEEAIFPPTPGDEPALTADEWLDGKDSEPIRVSLADLFQGSSQPVKKAVGLGSKIGSKSASKPAGGAAGSAAAPAAAVDSSTVTSLQKEIKTLKAELASAKSEVDELRRLKEELAAVKQHVHKNDERVTVLESLVQEVSDEEGK